MDLPDRAEAKSWQGRDVVDRDGEPLGRCHGVFADTDTGLPEWVLVEVADRRAFVPAGDAEQQGERVQVRFAREQVLSAPDVGDVASLGEEDEKVLYTHYGVAFSTSESESVLPVGVTETDEDASAPVGPDTTAATSGATTTATTTATTAASTGATSKRATAAPAPAAWAPREAPSSGSGGSSAAPLAAVAGLVAAVWLGLRERDRRAARRRSVAGRSRGLRQQLAAGSAVVAELTQHAAEVTSAAATSAASSTADATRAGRKASRAAGRSAARAAQRKRAESARRAAQQRKQLARTASRTGGAVTVTARQLAQAAGSVASGAGDAVTGSGRQLTSAVSAAGSALSDTTRSLADTAAAVPRGAAQRGRKVKRSVGRVVWDAVLASAAGAGYVAGARAGRERYDEIAAFAAQTAERPEVKRVTETVTGTVSDPERRAQATGALLEVGRPQKG